ncbi:MAG: hypothetical protein ACYSUI_15725 [Planctomycetota bacterium]|jgi:hypothetical protein
MRASGELVHVETDPGNVIVVPAWMLDPGIGEKSCVLGTSDKETFGQLPTR